MREIIGIGNDLFGDDGFGPRVVEYIQDNYDLPSDVEVFNAGSAPDFLLNEFLETETKKLVIVDVYDRGAKPGEILVLEAKNLPKVFPQRFTHNMPVVEVIREIAKRKNIGIWIVTCQPEKITAPDICTELSEPVRGAVPKAGDLIMRLINQNN